ncbi:hypothetical protein [Paramylibacter kogurei]|uniref:hypothetical protein n=1 Tax=Paramylibacter kogurei TaxID=1889778 RepID=UPI0010544054|nr:hypothetical protein [Amylibacter kogurei]
MRIYCKQTGREARKIQNKKTDLVPVYKCFPPNCGVKTDSKAIKFERIGDAADYLSSVEGSSIRVAANGEHRNAVLLGSKLEIG